MYEQLETLGVMAELKGLEYPAGVIKRGWDIILLNQFHDIIPGSAIGPVYEQTDREYEEILKSGAETALHLAEGMGSRICGQDKDTRREEPEEQKPEEHKIIVFNTQGYERLGISAGSQSGSWHRATIQKLYPSKHCLHR